MWPITKSPFCRGSLMLGALRTKTRSGGPKLSKAPPVVRRLVSLKGLGMVSAQTLIEEADTACQMLIRGEKFFVEGNWQLAIDQYFKAAAIATNVIFTANVNRIPLPEEVARDMNCLIEKGTHGIKKIMKVAAAKTLLHHEKLFHPGKKAATKGAAVFLRRLIRGDVK